MVEEKNILIHLNNTINDFLLNLYKTKNNLTQVNKNINNLNNNYFIEDKQNVCYQLNNIINEQKLTHLIEDFNSLQSIILNKIENCCLHHEWIQDFIDISPDKSQYIYYCKLCGVSKKN